MKNVEELTDRYPGFDKPVSLIKKFKASGDLFTIMLWDGSIIHHTAQSPALFRKWLTDHRIEDIAST